MQVNGEEVDQSPCSGAECFSLSCFNHYPYHNTTKSTTPLARVDMYSCGPEVPEVSWFFNKAGMPFKKPIHFWATRDTGMMPSELQANRPDYPALRNTYSNYSSSLIHTCDEIIKNKKGL